MRINNVLIRHKKSFISWYRRWHVMGNIYIIEYWLIKLSRIIYTIVLIFVWKNDKNSFWEKKILWISRLSDIQILKISRYLKCENVKIESLKNFKSLYFCCKSPEWFIRIMFVIFNFSFINIFILITEISQHYFYYYYSTLKIAWANKKVTLFSFKSNFIIVVYFWVFHSEIKSSLKFIYTKFVFEGVKIFYSKQCIIIHFLFRKYFYKRFLCQC